MAVSERLPDQEADLLYALDIGTRSVVGILGRREGERIRVIAIEQQPHARRAMMDGQIEDIGQVADTVRLVTARLEEKVRFRLLRASVAAAGRALRTEAGSSTVELSAPEVIGSEQIRQLELRAVSQAEEALQTGGEGQRLFLVGYTVTRYLLDQYPMTSLEGHTGRRLDASVVATFLPSGVVDSLYAVMERAGLTVASLTLEPIAALNAAIPADLRLLNLALADIGAGTSDIALCRDGSVVGYTMATVAGDEITEALMREYLVDFPTAEQMKVALFQETDLRVTDIMGIEQQLSAREVLERIDGAVGNLVDEIARRIVALNGGAPSALFLAGGGSQLKGLCARLAKALDMDPRRVALAGRYFQASVFSDQEALDNPALTTPLGILISSGLGLIRDSYRVELNGKPAQLFRSGALTALELLMMNGYAYGDLIGRSGRSLALQVDGRRQVFFGQPATPARLEINGVQAQLTRILVSGDAIRFTPARAGADRTMTAGQLAAHLHAAGLRCDGERLPDDCPLEPSMELTTIPAAVPAAPAAEEGPETTPAAAAGALMVTLNGSELHLPSRADGRPYYLMDLLERSGIDFQKVERPVVLRVNGEDSAFQRLLHPGDTVEIHHEETNNGPDGP